jgi:glucan phosphoethanolaminetransferase (alkaline phosphatase superfamily)
MELGTFLGRLWFMFWIVFLLGFTVLLWVSAIKRVIQEGVAAALLLLLLASIFTASFLAADAIKVLGR